MGKHLHKCTNGVRDCRVDYLWAIGCGAQGQLDVLSTGSLPSWFPDVAPQWQWEVCQEVDRVCRIREGSVG